MRPQSAKAKGRRLQQELRDALLAAAPQLAPDDVQSRSMGAQGEDLMLSPAARAVYPFSFECKAQEKLNVWQALGQAAENAKTHIPALVFKRNRSKTYVAIPLDDFIRLVTHG